MIKIYNEFMDYALKIAKSDHNEVPVGAVIVKNGQIIASSHNHVVSNHDPTAHAEILAIRKAGKILSLYDLNACDLYTTLEPCPMCAYAIALAKIKNLYFASYDKKRGAVYSNMNIFSQNYCFHSPIVYDGIMEEESEKMLIEFFIKLRTKNC